jgi:hypothetical protein
LKQSLNRFLWCGKDTRAKAKVAWDKVCVLKKEARLAIKKLDIWNQVSMLHHIWALFARFGSLWVAWVENNLFKGRTFWQVKSPFPKIVLGVGENCYSLEVQQNNFLASKLEMVGRFFLWYDVWHLEGCLFDKYGYRTIYDAGSSIGHKVSYIIRDGAWYWPSARSDFLVQIQSRLLEDSIGRDDIPVWRSSTGKYSCA